MKFLMSINYKFMDFSPKELVEIVKNNSKYCNGFEISIDYSNQDEYKYLESLAHECNTNNMHFQIHGNASVSIEEQVNFLKRIESISTELGYKIHIVLHSQVDDNKEVSIDNTINYLDEVINLIDTNKLIISLENLNDMDYHDRLDKQDITSIVANNELLFITYDIGHEIIDHKEITNLNPVIIPLITNVHLHSNNGKYSHGFDHKPILKDDPYWQEILKGILFLKTNNYKGPVVYEYDLLACFGETKEEKIKSYLKSIDYVSEHLI